MKSVILDYIMIAFNFSLRCCTSEKELTVAKRKGSYE